MDVGVESYDVCRVASVYPDNEGVRWWTKAWFGGREKGEPSVEISKKLAAAFINNQISKDSWLNRFFPKQMAAYYKAIDQTRNQLLGL